MRKVPLFSSLFALAFSLFLLTVSTYNHFFVDPAEAEEYMSGAVIMVEHDYYGVVVAMCILTVAISSACVAYCVRPNEQ